MTSILSRLLTADKPWSVPYQLPVQQQYQYQDGVSGNEFPTVAKKKRNTRKSQDPSVRFGRVPKREKAKILAAMQKVNASSQEKALCAELEDELRLLTTIVRAHEETCDYTREKVARLIEKARSHPVYTQCPPHLGCPLNPHIMEDGVPLYMEDFSERFAPAIEGVVGFAKLIPGFSFLSQDDQVTLLKAGVFEVLLVRLACMFDAQANNLICLNGQVLSRESLQTASNARFLLDSMFDFAERLNALHLSDSEIGLFCAVVVIAPDRPGLRNTDLVLKIQKKLLDILQKSIASSHPENPSIFGDLMKKIPDLRTLNTLHSEKLLAFQMEPRNRQVKAISTIEGIADSSVSNGNAYSEVPHDIWTQYAMSSTHTQCMTQEEDMRSTSPGVQSLHSGSSTGSEWSTTDSKDEHDLVDSPRSVSSGLCVDEAKSPIRTSSFSNSRNYVNEESWVTDNNQNVLYHQHLTTKRVAENPGSEHGSSSGDEGYFIDSPMKAPVYPKLHRVDSPTDSGIESGKEHGPSTTPTISDCSSPRSSVDEKLKDDHHSQKQDSIEDMPVLKRALQAPPLVNTNMLMDEAYRYHKKFRAARREAESPSSPGQVSLASTHSTLVKTLEQAPRYLSEQQVKRTDFIHNIIMRNETLPNQQSPSLPQHHQSSPQTPSQSHHVDAVPATCPSLQNNSYSFSSVPNQAPTQPSASITTCSAQQHKSLLICPNGYYVQHGGTVQLPSIYSSSTPVSWSFAQQPSSSAQTVTSASPVQVHAAQYEHSHMQQNSAASFCASSPVVNTSRAGSPRLLYNSRSPVTSTSLVMNGIGLNSSSVQSSVCPNDTRPIQSEAPQKPSGESQPLNLSKKLFSPSLLKMET